MDYGWLADNKRETEIYLSRIKAQDTITPFDEELFGVVVEKITVFNDKLIFVFRDGTEREYEMK